MTDEEQKIEQLRTGWLEQAARDAAEIVRLEIRIEELEATLGRIQQWCDAYPIGVFSKPSTEQMKLADKVLADVGISMTGMHGTWGRHILQGIGDIIRMVLK